MQGRHLCRYRIDVSHPVLAWMPETDCAPLAGASDDIDAPRGASHSDRDCADVTAPPTPLD